MKTLLSLKEMIESCRDWSKRISLFLQERCSLVTNLLLSFSSVFTLFITYELLRRNSLNQHSESAIESVIDIPLTKIIIASLSMFLFLVSLRIFDEFKDRFVDPILFPERCLSKGLVQYTDIFYLGIISVSTFTLINFLFGPSTLLLILLLFYAFLFYNYFFIPKILSQNLILALITHNPISFVLSLYLLNFFVKGDFSDLGDLMLLALPTWMSSIAWETSRKIRTKQEENNYVTYSKVIGVRGATLLPLFSMMIQFIIYSTLIPFNLFFLVVNSLYLIILSLFMIKPRVEISKNLNKLTESLILFNILFMIYQGYILLFKDRTL